MYTPFKAALVMATTANFEQEREELACLLSSRLFNRAPNLAHLLDYVCTKYFEGQADQIKEYNIAVEALGRPADFDQKRDSIVRVEAHRLRSRLKQFYESDGSSRAVRIEIPQGQYAPRFLLSQELITSGELIVSGPPPCETLGVTHSPAPLQQLETFENPRAEFSALVRSTSRPPREILFGVTLAILAIAGIIVAMKFTGAQARPRTEPATSSSIAVAALWGDELRILSGSAKPYTDRFGRVWQADRFFNGGSVYSISNHPIIGTRDQLIYQNRREGAFRYDIPLGPAAYELRLHFAETVYGDSNIAGGGETSRLFGVAANGKQLLEYIDVVADVGPNAPDIRVFKDIHPDADGFLHLEFRPQVNSAFLNAIEISPGLPGRLRPIRIVARDQDYIDRNGQTWGADRFFHGGQLVMRPPAVSSGDPELYRGERFGNITYSIPVAAGRYGINLHFAETWFGPDKPAKGGMGSRLFDIFCNGVALVRGLDVYKEAGGDNRPLERTFHGIASNEQGKLVLSLVPIRNYACVNGIEVVDESGADR
jgi:Malectin domain